MSHLVRSELPLPLPLPVRPAAPRLRLGSIGLLLLLATPGCVEKWEGEDADGDGVSVADGDCWDDPAGPAGSGLSGADIHPDVEADTPYDGVDQDCSGNDDYDLDGDGYVTNADHLGLTTAGVSGSGSSHIGAGDCLDDPAAATPSDNEFDDVGAAEIFPGATDVWYDGIDQDCREDDDYDADIDGDRASAWSDGTDCDDEDPGRAGTFQEVCDPENVDEDCDDLVNSADDSVDPTTVFDYFTDADEDGFGDPATGDIGCELPAGAVPNDDDCDDTRDDVNPDADEVCDAADTDEDCDGDSDDDDSSVVYDSGDVAWIDDDGDGYGDPGAQVPACDLSGDLVANDQDCDDTDAAVNPTATEVCDDGVDNDCANGADDADPAVDLSTGTEFYRDADSDGYGDATDTSRACVAPSGYVADNTDCDDNRSTVNPAGTEVCNDIDDDCDNDIDDDDASVAYGSGDVWYADSDSDSYGDPSSTTESCDAPTDHVRDNTDCDDSEPGTNPGATEICDAADVDEDCDGNSDDDDSSVDISTYDEFYADTDTDSYGDPGSTTDACDLPSGYSDDNTDCDDTDGDINPGATEICDAADVDEDCDGDSDDDDSSVDITTYDEFYADSDDDGYGDAASTLDACDLPASGYESDNTDCDDTDGDINPGATEICDAADVDEDCDGNSDDDDSSVDVTTYNTYYADTDGDGFGDELNTSSACDVPSGYDASSGDCDDDDGDVYPGAPETCNDGIDSDCDDTTCLLESEELEDAADLIWRGDDNSDQLGFRVALTPDLTGDGVADAVVSAHLDDPSKPLLAGNFTSGGIVRIADGTSGLALDDGTDIDMSTSGAAIYGEASAFRLGQAIVAGDFDDDGTNDLVVGSVLADPAAGNYGGKAYFISGPISSTAVIQLASGDEDAEIGGQTASDYLGWHGATGNTNGDSAADLAISAPQCDAASTLSTYGNTGNGIVYLLEGGSGTTWFDVSSPDLELTGIASGGCAGWKLAFGDVDGSGIDELLVSEPQAGSGGGVYFVDATQTGTVALSSEPKVDGLGGNQQFGSGLDSADLDADGYDDVIVGAQYNNVFDGEVYVLHGSVSGLGAVGGGSGYDVATLAHATISTPTSTKTRLGYDVSVAGDLDLDGETDLVIGAWVDDTTANNSGAAWVVYGPFSGSITLSSSTDAKFTGMSATEYAGGSVAGGEDVNNDGYDDVLIGGFGASDTTRTANGAAYLLLGRGN